MQLIGTCIRVGWSWALSPAHSCANKQDLPGCLTPTDVAVALGVHERVATFNIVPTIAVGLAPATPAPRGLPWAFSVSFYQHRE